MVLPIAALATAALYYRSVQANRLNETDTIVIADFANSTGDPVMGDALKQGLNIALRQSPFLSIVSDEAVSSTLKRMTLPSGTFLTPEVAREVCQRSGSKAYVGGAVAALGSEYVLGLNAVNCRSGDVMVREQITAPAKEKVIAALGDAASRLRGELGESLSTVQKYDVPLEEATTPSLEALKAFSLARAAALKGSVDSSIPFYKHAIEVDPDFAAAYAHLAQAYANGSQTDLARASIQRAFERRNRASEPEKFYITTGYYELATGETDKRIEALRLWRQMYPAGNHRRQRPCCGVQRYGQVRSCPGHRRRMHCALAPMPTLPMRTWEWLTWGSIDFRMPRPSATRNWQPIWVFTGRTLICIASQLSRTMPPAWRRRSGGPKERPMSSSCWR